MEGFDLKAALAAHPLPEGQPEAELNRSQLGIAMDVSENTITKWAAQGMPVREEGGNGREYRYSLAECYAWRMWRDGEDAATRRAADDAAAQMAMAFRNLDDDAPTGTVMSARMIKEESEADYARMRAAEQRGELVRRHRVEELFERVVVAYRNKMTAAVDFCEIEFGLSPEETEKLQGFFDALLVQSRIELESVTHHGAAQPLSMASAKQDQMPI